MWELLGGNPNACSWRIALEAAARAGRLEVLKWLIDHGCQCGIEILYQAATGGSVDVIEFVWKRIDVKVCNRIYLAVDSAASGSIPMLQWMVDHGLPLTARACATAVRYGHLDALRFLRSHHCPWDGDTLMWAARNGHLDILQWALASGCPWTAADRQNCLQYCSALRRPGMRRWIGECWPEEPPQEKE